MSVVRSLVGHGVGREMHEDPQVPNFGQPGRGPLLEEGMVLAIEPMVTAGRHAVRMGDDGWAIFSQDGSLAAHFEFTVAITAAGPRILTPWHEQAGRRGVTRARRPRTMLCYRVRSARRRPACPCTSARGSGGPCGSQSRSPAHRRRRNDEGTTVGQADVRKVQDHPAPWRGSRDLPNPRHKQRQG